MDKEKRLEKIKFRHQLMLWKRDTQYLGMPEKMEHPAYREIIGMGETAVVFILEDFRKGNIHRLFAALRRITGVNPVSPIYRGDAESMAGEWIRWGIHEGLIK